MKKSLAILMSLALMLSCIVGASFTSSAAPEYVEKTYTYSDAVSDFGSHAEGVEVDSKYYAVIAEEFLFGKYWTYEYRDPIDDSFKPMTAYYPDNHLDKAWAHYGWSRFYTSYAESAWYSTDYTYCSITANGKAIHPGPGADPAVTFIVPATGVITYEASIYCYGGGNTPANRGEDNYGNYISLWVNDTKVWPEDPEYSLIDAESTSPANPFEILVTSISVNEGDRVRLMIEARNNNNIDKGCDLAQYPIVTYEKAEVPIGNPKGEAPTDIVPGKYTSEGFTVSWSPTDNAAGYNLYINGNKHNTELITETNYVVTGLESNTIYNVSMTTVTNAGSESDPSDILPVRTKKGVSTEDTATSTTSPTDTTNEPVSTTTTVNKPSEKSFPWWIIIVAVVVVIAVAAVLVLVLGKKKKPAEETSSVEDVAPTEEKKDAE